MGLDVTRLVLDILNNNKDPGSLNSTFIVLIPKRKNPSSPKEFYLISLYNMIMNVVMKTIANRLKQFLLEVIGEEQNAFVHGRLFTDNAIIMLECFH